jgi:polysaccharide pyruvyl transferase WcaK-like protein
MMFPLLRDALAPEIDLSLDGEDFNAAILGGGTLINQSDWIRQQFEEALDRAVQGFVFGAGVGDVTFWGDQFEAWKPLLARCGFVGVRGPDSLALLHGHGVVHAECIGDPFLLAPSPPPLEAAPRRICVSAGSTHDGLWGGNDARFLHHLAETLRSFAQTGWEFRWLSVWKEDTPHLERLRGMVAAGSPPVVEAYAMSEEAMRTVGECTLMVGEKLHACALAALVGVPFVALEYRPKVRDFARSLGMGDWTICTAERNDALLRHLVESLAARRGEVRDQMIGVREYRREQLQRALALVKARAADRTLV